MKNKIRIAILTLVVSFWGTLASAQTTTIILLRHAEKDTSAPGSTMMKADPVLSKAGEARAARLQEILSAYRPDKIYATRFIRTKSTVTPLAAKYKLDIQYYDPVELIAFSKSLLEEKGKTIVVVGHSNTTPALVNLLINEKKYPSLDESVYGQFWIVTILDGKASVEVRNY